MREIFALRQLGMYKRMRYLVITVIVLIVTVILAVIIDAAIRYDRNAGIIESKQNQNK